MPLTKLQPVVAIRKLIHCNKGIIIFQRSQGPKILCAIYWFLSWKQIKFLKPGGPNKTVFGASFSWCWSSWEILIFVCFLDIFWQSPLVHRFNCHLHADNTKIRIFIPDCFTATWILNCLQNYYTRQTSNSVSSKLIYNIALGPFNPSSFHILRPPSSLPSAIKVSILFCTRETEWMIHIIISKITVVTIILWRQYLNSLYNVF